MEAALNKVTPTVVNVTRVTMAITVRKEMSVIPILVSMETVQTQTRPILVSARQVSLEIAVRMRMIVTIATIASIILLVLMDQEIIPAHAQKDLPEVTVKVNSSVVLFALLSCYQTIIQINVFK